MISTKLSVKSLLFLVFCFTHSFAAYASGEIEGDWVGGSNLFQNPVFIQLRFSVTTNEITGVANISQWKVSNRKLVNVTKDASHVHFEFPSTTGVPYTADGELKNGVIEGTISRGDQNGKFHLVAVARVDPTLYGQYTGAYQFINNKGDKEIHLITFSASGYLRWINLSSGQTSPVFPSSDSSFFFAATIISAPNISAATFNFRRDRTGKVIGCAVKVQGQKEEPGIRTSLYRIEQLKITTNNIVLSGTLILPGKNEKFPVVVVVPGSQTQSRDDTSPYEEFHSLISNGIGLFIYDKRGSGRSTGDWQKASFEDLANDVLAVIRQLKKHNHINKTKIGVWGFSQGGWIAPLAASRSKDISYVIMQSGGGVSNQQAEIGEQVARMQAQKLSDEEIKDAKSFMNLQFDAVRSPEGWNKFQVAVPAAKEKKWYRYTWGAIPKDNWLWKWWIPVVDYDPSIVLEKLKVPVLVMFGSADQYVPKGEVEKIASSIEQRLRSAGNSNVTTKVFEGANHEIFIKKENGQWVLAESYDETLKNWLIKINRK